MKEFSADTTEREFSDSLRSFAIPGERIVVAFSGGCDSLALLCLCAKVHGADLTTAVYVNHNIRPKAELDSEIALNRANCARLGVEFVVRTIQPSELEAMKSSRKGGTEDAARVLRYRLLEEERVLLGASWILTAHHRDDQNETILMRLAAKAPLCSMRGILKVSGHVGRPLLTLHRRDLEAYVSELGMQWSTDSTNSDNTFKRNEIRNTVIPVLECEHPDYEGYLEQMRLLALRLWDSIPSGNIVNPADTAYLLKLDDDAREMYIYRMWDAIMPSTQLPGTLVARVVSILGRDNATASANGGTFSTYGGKLYLTSNSDDAVYGSFEGCEPSFDGRTRLPRGLVLRCGADEQPSENPEKDLLVDPSRFKGRVVVRFVRQGDRIFLKDGGKTVLRLLQDMKVAPVLRKRAVVIEDESGIQAVFASHIGGRDRLSAHMRSGSPRVRCVLALN